LKTFAERQNRRKSKRMKKCDVVMRSKFGNIEPKEPGTKAVLRRSPRTTPQNTMSLRNVSIGLSAAVLLGIVVFLGNITFGEGIIHMVLATLGVLLFCGFPPIISIMLSARAKNFFSQVILSAASLFYGVWFTYVMYEAFYVNSDALSGVVLLFVGIFFLPILLPIWLVAIVVEIWHRKKYLQVRTEP